MTAPQEVLDLVEHFERQRDTLMSGAYNEAQLRKEFLDPLFAALGWDMANRQGHAEAYKEVIHEDSIRIVGEDGGPRAPDYCFRIGGTRKFFVEAKKPAVNVREQIEPAYQLRRYAWSAKLPLSILTDFEELAVYDCRVKPAKTDKATVARVMYFTYRDYAEKWDEIAGIFAQDAILKGSFDKYAEDTKRKRGTAEVDSAFLKEIEGWREALAHNTALRNKALSQRDLNYAVQSTIDRIVFLRICEDRDIERYARLMGETNGPGIYGRLFELFKEADAKYNSGLFHFQAEKDQAEEPDRIASGLVIDDKVLKDIIKGLYYPDCPYEFSVLGADILGQVYEQFLGKVIRLTAGHRAVIEEKPEVRRAGGVYYTPTYIVDYIVEHTVGKLLEGKTPKQAVKLKILDPACGSGSFLIGAYQFLLDWHLKWYLDDGADKHSGKELYQRREDDWRLTTGERKRILVNNIHGVDIDPQAVEVTKLSLLLKVLEGETEQSLNTQMRLYHERALPDLGRNIKCGNSLIGTDFYEGQQMTLLDEEELYRVNAFDWDVEFAEIMKAGGFDAVIGNPPYLSVDDVWGRGDPRLGYLKRAYSDVYSDKTDVLFYFLSRGVELSRGLVGFIVSRAFREAYKAERLRGWLSASADIVELLDFRNHYVFRRVGIATAILVMRTLRKQADARVLELRGSSLPVGNLSAAAADPSVFDLHVVPQKTFSATPWIFARPEIERLLARIDEQGDPLSGVLVLGQGMQTGRNAVFGGLTQETVESWGLRDDQYYVRVRNSDIQRYGISDSGRLLLYLEDAVQFEGLPEGAQEYLRLHEDELKARAAYQRGDCEWWKYTWPLHRELMDRDKLYCPYLAGSNRFALDERRVYLGLTDTTVLFDGGQPESLLYLLALLNSELLTFRFKYMAKLKSGNTLEYFWNNLSRLHVRRIDFAVPQEASVHETMTNLGRRSIELCGRLAAARTPREKEALRRAQRALDVEIDQRIYHLYGFSEAEAQIAREEVASAGATC